MGQGISYNDNDIKNNGGYFRKEEGVDIQTLSKSFAVVLEEGEWLNYEINSGYNQEMTINVMVKSNKKDAVLAIIINGAEVGKRNINKDRWRNIEFPQIDLKTGKHSITLKAIRESLVIDYLNLVSN